MIPSALRANIARFCLQLDEHRLRAVEAFAVELVLEQASVTRSDEAGSTPCSEFSEAGDFPDEDVTAPRPRVESPVLAGLRELRDATPECICDDAPSLRHLDEDGHLQHCPAKPAISVDAAAPGVALDFDLSEMCE